MLEVIKISKTYHRKPVLQDVDFILEPGRCLGIAGHNGSGKSTLLSIIAGVLPPDSGDVVFDGAGLRDRKTWAGLALGYVPQENSLLDDLTVKETLAFWQRVYKQPATGLFSPSSIAVMLGLGEIRKKRIARLSGGMRKRVSIAIALLRQPRLLLLDEALSALDRVYRAALEDYLEGFLGRGNGILYCSHDINELTGICSRILVLRQGSKVFDGETETFPTEAAALDFLLDPL